MARRIDRWGLGAALLVLLTITGSLNYAHLIEGVEAGRFQVQGQDSVRLRIRTDVDTQVEVTIGQNKVKFQAKKDEVLDTGHLRISGDTVFVKLLTDDGQRPNECEIRVGEIPQGTFKRFCFDVRAPVTTVTLAPQPNPNDWINQLPVTVTLRAEDEQGGSGIKEIHYKIGSGTEVVVGRDQLTLSESGRVATTSFPLSSDGIHSISFWAVDQAGNVGERNSRDVRIDSVPPSATADPEPRPNRHGWNRTNVTVSFRGSDALSDIASCTPPVTVTAETSGQTVSGTCTDRAGNTSAPASITVKIDKTKPQVRQAGSPTCSQPGNNNWCRGEISVPFEATDDRSGFENGLRTMQFTNSTSAERRRPVLVSSGLVKDLAENEADPISVSVEAPFAGIDRTPPQIRWTQWSCSKPLGNNWCPGEISVLFEATDNVSGLLPNGQVTVQYTRSTAEEGRESVYVRSDPAEDVAGNRTDPIRVGPFSIDRTGPVTNLRRVSSTPQGEPDAVSWDIQDPGPLSDVDRNTCRVSISGPGITGVGGRDTFLSGVDACRGRKPFNEIAEKYGSGSFTVHVEAQDLAGNPQQDTPENPASIPIDIIANQRPLANPNGPYRAVCNGEGCFASVMLDGRGSSDPDGDPLTYAWDFGDGSPPTQPSRDAAVVTHEYRARAEVGGTIVAYQACLTVDDGRGGSDTKCTDVLVFYQPFVPPKITDVRFKLNPPSGPKGEPVTATFEIDFEDPNGDVATLIVDCEALSPNNFCGEQGKAARFTVDISAEAAGITRGTVIVKFSSGRTESREFPCTRNDEVKWRWTWAFKDRTDKPSNSWPTETSGYADCLGRIEGVVRR